MPLPSPLGSPLGTSSSTMTKADFTTTGLLASIRRHGMIPGLSGTTVHTLDDADLLAMASEELKDYIAPFVLSTWEEYLVVKEDLTAPAGNPVVPIPARAISNAVRDVLRFDGKDYIPLSRIEPDRDGDSSETGTPEAFRLEGNNIILSPIPTASTIIRVKYYRRPSDLVAVPASLITAASPLLTTQIQLTVAGGDDVFAIGDEVDIVPVLPNFDLIATDPFLQMQVTAVATGVITVGALTPTDITAISTSKCVGAYLCFKGQAPVAQVPVECHSLLALRTAQVAIESLGAKDAAQALEARCEKKKQAIIATMEPRTQGKGRVIINRYGPGWGNRGRRRFR